MDRCILSRTNEEANMTSNKFFFLKGNKDYLMSLTGSQILIPYINTSDTGLNSESE